MKSHKNIGYYPTRSKKKNTKIGDLNTETTSVGFGHLLRCLRVGRRRGRGGGGREASNKTQLFQMPFK